MRDNMSLGDFIRALKSCEAGWLVYYDFCSLHPTSFGSYRGYYEQLALGWADEGDPPTVARLLEQAIGALGATFTGYKGGDFTMGRGTPLWVANYGRVGSTAIVDVKPEEFGGVIIETAHIPT